MDNGVDFNNNFDQNGIVYKYLCLLIKFTLGYY